jgi:hypothetical protein
MDTEVEWGILQIDKFAQGLLDFEPLIPWIAIFLSIITTGRVSVSVSTLLRKELRRF